MGTKNGKIFKILIIVFVLILLIVAGIGCYLYAFTDSFKTPQQLFYKYISGNNELVKMLKQEEQPELSYEANTKIAIEGEKIELEINEKKDVNTKKNEVVLTAKDGENQIFDLSYLNKDNVYGIKSSSIVAKYIAVRNKDLKSLAEKLDITELDEIPDSIQLSNYSITEQEKDYLINTYLNVINNIITEEKFTVQKDVNIICNQTNVKADAYTLNLSKRDAYNIVNNILNTAKTDVTLMNILTRVVPKLTTEDIVSAINDIIMELSDAEVTEELLLKITVYANDKTLLRTQIDFMESIEEQYTITLDPIVVQNQAKMILSIAQLGEEDIYSAEILMQKSEQSNNTTIRFLTNNEEVGNVQINKINNAQQSNINAKIKMEDVLEVNIQRTEKYSNNVEISDVEKESVILNDLSEEQLKVLIVAIVDKIAEQYGDILKEVEIEEEIDSSENESIEEETDVTKSQEVAIFNAQFETYKGEVNGASVKSLLTKIQTNNTTQSDLLDAVLHAGELQGSISAENLKRTEIIEGLKNKIEGTKKYKVELTYNDTTKKVKRVTISEI